MSEILDPLGRTPISAGMKAQIEQAFASVPKDKRGALIVMADEHGATAHLAARLNGTWKVAGGLGVPWNGTRLNGWVSVAASW